MGDADIDGGGGDLWQGYHAGAESSPTSEDRVNKHVFKSIPPVILVSFDRSSLPQQLFTQPECHDS